MSIESATGAFEGDVHLEQTLLELKENYSLGSVVETGTHTGTTTKWFCQNFDWVTTIECKKGCIVEAERYLAEFSNVEIIWGDSSRDLFRLLPKERCLVFLDAHWYENPLRAELSQIRRAVEGGAELPVIAIHDFQVPDHPEFGYDSYPEFVYNWESIEENVRSIGDYSHFYNETAVGGMRGCLFLVPRL